uniref:Protoporphyrinogen oxidase n=1 Tax=Eptatretus burgeri TaxID=7764 RepID=A0A8C4WX08_EPTBU
MGRTIAVLGGGITGLSASYYLSRVKAGIKKVVLVEASGRLGGWLHSLRLDSGAVFELGPRALRPAGNAGANALNLVEDLGLSAEVLPVLRSAPAAQNRFLYSKGQLHALPSSFKGLLKVGGLLSRPLLWTALKEPFVRRGSKKEDETIYGFLERRMGKEVAELLADPLCRGIFAGDARYLSLRSCLPAAYEAQRLTGSLLLGLVLARSKRDHLLEQCELVHRARAEQWAQWSLARGLSSLPEALTRAISSSDQQPYSEIVLGEPVQALRFTGNGQAEITLPESKIIADHVISCLPAHALTSILHPSLAAPLTSIQSVTVAVVNLEYPGNVLPVQGFGHLVPSSEEKGVLGIIYDSDAFPSHNRPGTATTRLTVMLGGAWFEEVFGEVGEGKRDKSREYFLRCEAVSAVVRHLGVMIPPSVVKTSVHQNCIPQYHEGHWKIVGK